MDWLLEIFDQVIFEVIFEGALAIYEKIMALLFPGRTNNQKKKRKSKK